MAKCKEANLGSRVVYLGRWKVRARNRRSKDYIVKSCTLTSRELTEDYPSQLPFTTANAINKAVALAPRLV